jgi:hypothetical protein
MKTTSTTDRCDSRVATQQYESLRANAMGRINRAAKLTLFLRDGMSAWLRGLGKHGDDRRAMHRERSPLIAEADSNIPMAELVSILTDAVLNATEPAGYVGGRG